MLMPTHAPSSTGGGGTLIVDVSPNYLYGFKYGFGSIRTSTASSAMATNAVGAVTYTWEYVSGDVYILPEQGGQASTRFRVYADLVPYSYEAVWRCKATDSASNVGYSQNVTITLESLLQDGGIIP